MFHPKYYVFKKKRVERQRAFKFLMKIVWFIFERCTLYLFSLSILKLIYFLTKWQQHWHTLIIFLNNTRRENCVLINSVPEFDEIEAWLLLTFFVCLYNQLFSVYSFVTYWRVQMFEIHDSSNRHKWFVLSAFQ